MTNQKNKTVSGVAIYTDGTHRMVRLVATGNLRRYSRNLTIALCSAYRQQCPALAMMYLDAGYSWSGHSTDDHMRAIAAFERGESRWDCRAFAENVITL